MIIVHSIAEAKDALKAGVLTLQSAPDMLGYAGAAYVKAMLDEIRLDYPDASLIADAAGDASQALAALRAGLMQVRFIGGEPYLSQLQAIARESGAEIVGD